MGYGIQLYSVRDLTAENLGAAMEQMSALGYESVEFAGYGNGTVEDAARYLKQYGLKTAGSHLSLSKMTPETIENTIRELKLLEDVNPVCPGAPIDTRQQLDETIRVLNFAQPRFAREGMTLHFHNHHKEFLPNQDGQIPFDELHRRTDVKFEVDTYWAFTAGQDPVALIERLKKEGRITLIHLKDGTADKHGYPLGKGCAPVAQVYDKALELGLGIIVESETLTPSGTEEARVCMEYLKQLERRANGNDR